MCRNFKLTQQCSLHTRKKLSPVLYDTKPPSHIRHTMDNVIFLFSKWAVNNSLACFFFFWIQLDNDASISSISCQNADALVTLLLIFFFPFGICDEASHCFSLKQHFPAMKSLSVGKAFSKSTVELSKDLIRMLILCPLSSVFRLLMASHWRLFTIWGCETCYLAALMEHLQNSCNYSVSLCTRCYLEARCFKSCVRSQHSSLSRRCSDQVAIMGRRS